MTHDLKSWGLTDVELRAAIGTDFALESAQGDSPSIRLRHQPTGLPFILVPGGTFEMGLTELDLGDLSEWIGFTRSLNELLEREYASARPPHLVEVKPFLCSVQILRRNTLRDLGHRVESHQVTRPTALEIAQKHQFRLPSEAELEWLARDGNKYGLMLDVGRRWSSRKKRNEVEFSRFGVCDLFKRQWAADDFHANYEGAPTTSVPWMNGSPNGVLRGGLEWSSMQDEEELFWGMSARRVEGQPGALGAVRLARDILPTRFTP